MSINEMLKVRKRGAHKMSDEKSLLSGIFDAKYYLSQNPDVAAAGVDPLEHFMTYGWNEKRDPNALFDTSYYLSQNPDVVAAGINPLGHFMNYGWKENRSPGSLFDTSYYMKQNPDVAAAGIDPLEHYVSYGQSEGRKATNGFTIEFDYSRYDISGFFTNHPERQAVVAEACKIWESIIKDEFTDIPMGTVISFLNPNNGGQETLTLTSKIDDLRIYLGSYSATDTSLGNTRVPSVVQTGNAALDSRYNSYDYIEPWVGSIAFNENYAQSLYFDPTPNNPSDDVVPSNKYDFLYIVLHEIGHVLGLGPQNAGSQYVENINGIDYFTGPHVEQVYGGPVPLNFSSGAHIASAATMDAIMKPSLNEGIRSLPTSLDKAFFADLGYHVS